MKMKTITFCIVYFISCIVIVYSFSLAPSVSLHCSTSPRISFESFPSTKLRPQRGGKLVMGNNAKFGIFSPAVYAAKWVLGDAKLNKIRGKVISLHSQAITDWCIQYGAYNLRTKLIKMAKTNGDKLGFLV